jgi:hypothetical protein
VLPLYSGGGLIFYNAPMDYLFAALIFVFMVTVLVVLWKREHPKKR